MTIQLDFKCNEDYDTLAEVESVAPDECSFYIKY